MEDLAVKWKAIYLRVGVLITCLSLASCQRPTTRLTHEIYIWQRVWNSDLREAAAAAKSDSSGFCPLAAWLEWQGGVSKVKWADVPWHDLAGQNRHVFAAIRVEPRAGSDLPVVNEVLTATSRECVRRAALQGVTLDEIQLDFDAAESQLTIYTGWLGQIRAAVAPVRVTFTALPCWLNQPNFVKLAHAADGYVLQVHAAEKPTPESTLLCDPAKARQWVNQASRAAPGVPFRVALPTYTYELAFGTDNHCIGVVAEGESRDWPEASRVIFLKADPAALADLLKTWNVNRPAELTGVLWFRLPTDSDTHNWRMTTLRSLIHGIDPRPVLSTRASLDSDGKLCDLTLLNSGDADANPPAWITVSWQNAKMEAGEALAGYAMTATDSSAEFHPRGAVGAGAMRVIRPGQAIPLGWLRFSDPITNPKITISNNE